MSETPEEMFNKYYTHEDFARFKWRILHYMCDMCDKHGTFTETELFFHTRLRAYFDEKLNQEYLHGKRGTLYKLLMDHVMSCLERRNAVKKSLEYEYGGSEMVLYKKSEILENVCPEILKIGIGAQTSDLDRLLPQKQK
ncbi:MAG TPA: hypothetical protein VE548_13905 [Nitrososphaeraceae archaeon]|nr:hypothetical protein [Nitrososphaeraceae archaeon]